MKTGLKEMKKEYKNVNIDQIEDMQVSCHVIKWKLLIGQSVWLIASDWLIITGWAGRHDGGCKWDSGSSGSQLWYAWCRWGKLLNYILQLIKSSVFHLKQHFLVTKCSFIKDELEAELDALGDEIALDDDTSYLDDAISAPSVPGREPGN